MYNEQPPHWAQNAIPTPQGWVSPVTGELLVGYKFIDPELLKPTVEVTIPFEPEEIQIIEDVPPINPVEPAIQPISKKSKTTTVKGVV